MTLRLIAIDGVRLDSPAPDRPRWSLARIATAAAFVLALTVGIAVAEPVPWTGPGPIEGRCNTCATPCNPADALDHLPPMSEAERAYLIRQMADAPPVSIPLRTGDRLLGIAGCRLWDSRERRVVGDWTAEGWVAEARDGSLVAIVIVEACGNPAVLVRPQAKASPTAQALGMTIPPVINAAYTPAGQPLSTLPLGARDVVWRTDRDEPRTPDAPSPIPLPGSVWAFLAGLAGLSGLRQINSAKES